MGSSGSILGLNAYHADASAVLIRDGLLVAAVEEERFRRIKHCAGFPAESIRKCLEIGRISGAEVDAVAVARRPAAHLGRKVAYALRHRPRPRLVGDRLRNWRRVGGLRSRLGEALGVEADRLPRVHAVEHHPAHLASAFFVSPFDDAAVCAVDGFGDFVSTSAAVGSGNRIRVLSRVHFPHSLGLLYTAVTQYLGFTGYGDEFKVMGLAPYGEPSHTAELRRLVRLRPRGAFELDLHYFRHWREGVPMTWEDGAPTLGPVYSGELVRLLGPARDPRDPLTDRHRDIARSLQAVYEEAFFHLLRGVWERTRTPRLCLAGGCAMNSVANGKVRDQTPFTSVYIQPAAGDDGTALGAALHVLHEVWGQPRRFVMEHAAWGTEHPVGSFEPPAAALEAAGAWVRRFEGEGELCRFVAGLLADGKVVGWFQGRMEWGARALGNRSILADPRRPQMREILNSKIKYREPFRPFAPAVAEEALHDYFVDAAADPFMQQVYPVRPGRRAEIPAVTHVDGSARLQTVNARQNPRFHRLLLSFGELTGVPILLNTSFNENEPIVETPEQALDCFGRTRMDALVLGDLVVQRSSEEQSPVPEKEAAVCRESFF